MTSGILSRSKLLLSVLAIIGNSPMAFGAGYSLFEQGAKATGMGGAFAATADDPSAIFYNVAGIAYQRETKAMTGATWITFNAEFESDPLADFPGGDPEATIPGTGVREFYEDHNFVLPNTYLVIPIGKNSTFGIGQFTAFGLRTDWENRDSFSGRFISQDANLKTVSIQPSFAMKSSSGKFALGVGIEYRGATVSLDRNVPGFNPFTNRFIDVAHVRLESDVDDDIGFNVGLLFAPNDDWRIGLSHRTAQDIEFSGTATFTQIPTGNPQLDGIIGAGLPPNQPISLTLPFPSISHFGIANTSVPDWTIELDVVRMSWSRFDTLLAEFETTPAANLMVEENWKDVFSYRIGAAREVSDNWDLYLGAVYDENPQPTEAVSPILPDSDRAGVSIGFGFEGDHWSLAVTEFYLKFQERSTEGRSQDNYNGTYNTFANLISFNVGYRF